MTQKYLSKWTRQKMSTQTLDMLESLLWSVADILQGNIDSAEYKHYFWIIIF